MKFLIEGREYDMERGLSKASLYTLFELKSKYGIGIKSMAAIAKRIDKLADPTDLLDDKETFEVFLAIVWLARRYAGEKLTLEEANSMPLDSLQIVDDDGEEVTDPKALTVSVPAAPAVPPRTTLRT